MAPLQRQCLSLWWLLESLKALLITLRPGVAAELLFFKSKVNCSSHNNER